MTAVAIDRTIRDTYHNVRSYRDYVAPIRLILVKIAPTVSPQIRFRLLPSVVLAVLPASSPVP